MIIKLRFAKDPRSKLNNRLNQRNNIIRYASIITIVQSRQRMFAYGFIMGEYLLARSELENKEFEFRRLKRFTSIRSLILQLKNGILLEENKTVRVEFTLFYILLITGGIELVRLIILDPGMPLTGLKLQILKFITPISPFLYIIYSGVEIMIEIKNVLRLKRQVFNITIEIINVLKTKKREIVNWSKFKRQIFNIKIEITDFLKLKQEVFKIKNMNVVSEIFKAMLVYSLFCNPILGLSNKYDNLIKPPQIPKTYVERGESRIEFNDNNKFKNKREQKIPLKINLSFTLKGSDFSLQEKEEISIIGYKETILEKGGNRLTFFWSDGSESSSCKIGSQKRTQQTIQFLKESAIKNRHRSLEIRNKVKVKTLDDFKKQDINDEDVDINRNLNEKTDK